METIADLAKVLETLPKDLPVLVSTDEEGNRFAPWSSYSIGYCDEPGYDMEYWEPVLEGEKPPVGFRECIVLWP